MLQLNNGDNTFSEIGRLAGVEATDWSWGALIFDMDNDGWKDIFVANGIYQDLTNQDFLNYIANEETARAIVSSGEVDYKKLIDLIPSVAVPNYAFQNQGNLRFSNKALEWGLASPGFSNGSAYADLDNDGDLDLVVNNVNMPVAVYRNETNTFLPENRYLKVVLQGEEKNPFAIGTKLTIKHQGKEFYLEQMPMRGFESSVDPRPNFGLGNIQQIDSLIVEWYDGKWTVMTQVPTNQTLLLAKKDANVAAPSDQASGISSIQDITAAVNLNYTHRENLFVDFDRDRLIYHMLSTEGPKMCTGDVNFYVGGAKDQPGKLFVQLPGGKFKSTNEALFEQDKISEDTDCIFFDADGDGDLDLYVASGGSEFPNSAAALADRLYFNDGKGNFKKSPQLLPTFQFENTACVAAADFDADGDQDLFVGIRAIPFLYGVPASGYLLQNDGKGNFTNITQQVAPALEKIGMLTDAIWADTDQDKDLDLILIGEWMPIKVLKNEGGKLSEITENTGLSASNGWWNCIEAGDFDQDGDTDFVVGNHGLNSRFRASADKPVRMYVNDFDQNGTAEQIICTFNGDKIYPMLLRHDLVSQLPGLKKKYLKYDSFKDQTAEDIFEPEQLKNAVKSEVYNLQSVLLLNQGNSRFEVVALPIEAQFSPIFGLLVEDFDADGHLDILTAGNFFSAKPEVGRYDASYGLLLKGNGKGDFAPVKPAQTGIYIQGEARDAALLRIGNERVICITRNNNQMQFFKL